MVLLNEFVDGASRLPLKEGMASLGLRFTAASTRIGKHNQIFIACRWPMHLGEIQGPDMIGGAGRSNFLHVRIPDRSVEVVGIRVPMYRTASETAEYWRKLEPVVRAARGRPIVWIGDLNSDPDSPGRRGGSVLRELEGRGWKIPRPTGPWSFFKGTKIDHALVSECVEVKRAEYVIEIDGSRLASGDKTAAVSDHAALVVEIGIERGAAV